MSKPSGRTLVIFGAGTLARLARSYFERDTNYRVAACTVHREHVHGPSLGGLPTVPFEDLPKAHPPAACDLFVAVGYRDVNRARAEIIERTISLGYHLATLVSPRAHVWNDLRIGRNCLVFDGVVIEPGAQLGDGVILWSGAQVSHDVSIGDNCFVAPNAVVLGGVRLGARSFVGGNATIRDGVTVAEDCVIGAGTVIKRDTSVGEMYAVQRTLPRPDRHHRNPIGP